MLKLKVGESGNKSTTVKGKVAECIHTTVHPSLGDGERYQLTWRLNFANMTEEQILAAAAEHFVIKIRRSFSKVEKPKNNDWNNVEFDCAKYITQRVSKIDKIAKTLADFSDEQLAAMGLVRAES